MAGWGVGASGAGETFRGAMSPTQKGKKAKPGHTSGRSKSNRSKRNVSRHHVTHIANKQNKKAKRQTAKGKTWAHKREEQEQEE